MGGTREGRKQQINKPAHQHIGPGLLCVFARVVVCCFTPPMHFDLVDRVLEQSSDRIVTLKHITAAEEYLQDHFPTFPVLPGVMMLEAMVQAGRRMLQDKSKKPLVLGRVRALKYGRFVKPGSTLRVEVTLHKDNGDQT